MNMDQRSFEKIITKSPQKIRKGARGAPKEKTGCRTCKIRRKKCDETKPSCSQCTRTGRKCDFLSMPTYMGQGPITGAYDYPPRISKITQNPSMLPPLSTTDLAHFEYFSQVCTKEFSPYFETNLWERVILRAAYTETCILHAVLAIGAIGRAQNPSNVLVGSREASLEYTLKQYNLSIQELNQRLDNSEESWKLAILGSLLFITIDELQGRDDRVQIHLKSAFAILKDRPVEEGSFPARRGITTMLSTKQLSYNETTLHLGNELNEEDEFSHLINALSSLDFHSSMQNIKHTHVPLRLQPLPPIFSNLAQARKTLTSIITEMNALFRRNTIPKRALPPNPLSPHIIEDLSALRTQFQSWKTLFNNFTTCNLTTQPISLGGIKILHIHHLVAEIQMASYFQGNEMVYDEHLQAYGQVLNLSTAVMETAHASFTQPKYGPCRILDIGVIQPLFFVAQKCRDGVLRRKALEIIKTVRHERVHDVLLVVEVLRWIIEREEEDMEDGFIKEEKRLFEVDLEMEEYMCWVKAWRRRDDGSCELLSAAVTVDRI